MYIFVFVKCKNLRSKLYFSFLSDQKATLELQYSMTYFYNVTHVQCILCPTYIRSAEMYFACTLIPNYITYLECNILLVFVNSQKTTYQKEIITKIKKRFLQHYYPKYHLIRQPIDDDLCFPSRVIFILWDL
jgi:hypothetical protein